VIAPTFVLDRAPLPSPPPLAEDRWQRAVVEHRGGPLLVLAGPGTGKTTTLVEAVAARVADGLRPDQVLVLTFSRKAAAQLRERITARLGWTTAAPAAWTFHAFCYALLREHQDPLDYAAPLRLLSGPEQDLAVRELLRGDPDVATVSWPPGLLGCLRTRGFADEVRAVIAKARESGLEPADLGDFGRQAGRRDWPAVAAFLAEYLDVLDAQGALDYAELVHRAGILASRPDVQAGLRDRFRAVFVDEYQDTDPAQAHLVQVLAGAGGDLVVVGDPDQSIYGFRGADVSGLLEFPDRFRQPDGSPARVLTLGSSRRAGATLLASSRRLAARIPMTGLPGEAIRAHRDLRPLADAPPGVVTVAVYPSVWAEAQAVADVLRRARLVDLRPWSQMAVVVRSGVRSIPLWRRVLAAAGVPVEVAGDELPLAREAAVAPLLWALRCAADPAQLDAERARALLLSPLGGADSTDLRRLGRELRVADAAGKLTGPAGQPAAVVGQPDVGKSDPPVDVGGARPSGELLRLVVDRPELLSAVRSASAAPARRAGRLIAAARAELAAGGSAEQALWKLWEGSDWPDRLEAASYAGGAAGRGADRDLDAVVALFDTVARSQDRQPHRGVLPLIEELEAQQIPGDTLAERPVRGEAVRLLTAHRSKGLEWDLVVVPGVQEGVWPDLRRRGSLLEPDRISADGPAQPPTLTQLLGEERRLFYVAVTRARRRLLVSAVDSTEEDGQRPSRFLAELGVEVEAVQQRTRRPLTLSSLVAQLRLHAVDPATSPALRAAATARLAMLADARRPDGTPVAAGAHPDSWWGMAEQTDPGTALYPADTELSLSGSAVTGVAQCPLKWFLGGPVHARTASSSAMALGNLIHALVDDVAKGRCPADLDVLMERLDVVWPELGFAAPWQSELQCAVARDALRRFLTWSEADRGRELVASEQRFDQVVELPTGPVRLRGAIDRVEVDGERRVHVVDFKTGKTQVATGELPCHPQLGMYQLAVRAGALDGVAGVGTPAVPGGAELVQLGCGRGDQPKVQPQDPLPPDAAGAPSWARTVLADVAARIRGEEFGPVPGDYCRRCEFRVCCPAQPEGRAVVE
jgi:superfamily I DNA/RNA helicase/RecB family exonuclease